MSVCDSCGKEVERYIENNVDGSQSGICTSSGAGGDDYDDMVMRDQAQMVDDWNAIAEATSGENDEPEVYDSRDFGFGDIDICGPNGQHVGNLGEDWRKVYVRAAGMFNADKERTVVTIGDSAYPSSTALHEHRNGHFGVWFDGSVEEYQEFRKYVETSETIQFAVDLDN